jgi:thymidylate synthase
MSQFDQIYNSLVQEVLEQGSWDKDQHVRTIWADGTPAYSKSIIAKQIHLDGKEVPILTSKQVFWKTAIHEILWFYVHKTSDCHYLDEHDVKIWRQWTHAENHIGKAYGYQLGKSILLQGKFTNQVDHLLEQLKTNPASRRHVLSLWNIDDLDQMQLYPCWWATQWLVKEGRLHLITQSRSADLALGFPFNVFQYYVLLRMVAQVTGYEVGTLTCNLNDCHIYERHIPLLAQQIQYPSYPAPTLILNPAVTALHDFHISDFTLVHYQHGPKIAMEVAI